MEMDATRLYAVLTGDIVGSSKLESSARRQLPDWIRGVGGRLRETFPEDLPVDLDVFRGDSWQLLVERAENALLLALAFRAHLKSVDGPGIDSRVGIGIGIGAGSFLPGNRVSEGDGPAFRASGAALEGMAGRARLDVRFSGGSEPPGIRVVVRLTDAIVQDWTPKQARALAGTLAGRTQEEIGLGWTPVSISQQAVSDHLDRANWDVIEEALEAFAAWVREWEQSIGLVSTENRSRELSKGPA